MSSHLNCTLASSTQASATLVSSNGRSFRLLFAFLTIGLSLTSLQAQDTASAKTVDPTGTWKWTSEMGGNIIESVLTIHQDGDNISGRYQDQNVNVEIEDAKFENGKLSWTIEPTVRDMTILAKFTGKVGLDSIDGDVEIGVDGESYGDFDWNAKRFVSKDDVVGKWDFEFTADDGETYKPLLVVRQNEEKLVATIGNDDGEIEIKDIALDDNILTFGYTADYNGSPIELQYKCMPRGNSLTGTLSYEVEDASGENPVVARRRQLAKSLRPLVGTWTFLMSTPEGDQTAELKIAADGDELEASLDGQQGAVEIEDFEVSNEGVLTFEFTVEHSGVEVHNTWESRLSGDDEMEGAITYDFEGQEGTLEFTGKRGS